MIYYLSKWIALFFLKIFFRFRVEGRENFPAQGPCIVVSNHASYLDPIVIGCAAPRRIYFMAKEELFRNPLSAFFLKQLGAFPLRREEGDRQAIKRIFSLLREENVVGLFPEGTRNEGKVRDFRPGAIKLLLKAQVPVIVGRIDGTFDSLPRGRKIPRLVPISVFFSPPLVDFSTPLEVFEAKIKEKMEDAASGLPES